MIRRVFAALIAATVFCCAYGTATTPAFAKKKQATATTAQVQGKRNAARNCRTGPVPPFMRNPRYMNRGFLRKKCRN